MFKKKPTIKTLSPLRSSDRRKIADRIIEDYGIQLPKNDGMSEETTADATDTLSTLRRTLLPDNALSAKFSTTHGPQLKEVNGMIYVGSYGAGDQRVLWVKIEEKLYPTVYTLWKNPGILPLLHTPSFVVGKLKGGADLMTPGLAGPPFPEKAVKGSLVAVASLEDPSIPIAVGECVIDVATLKTTQGAKGQAVETFHWAGDELWDWSTSGRSGAAAPQEIPEWLADRDEQLAQATADLTVEDTEEESGGVSLAPAEPLKKEPPLRNEHVEGEDAPLEILDEEEGPKLTTPEIDEAFEQAFLFGVHQQIQQHRTEENHGLKFPLNQSFVMSQLVLPFLQTFTSEQTAALQIKKTSWKNARKFIISLDKRKWILAKDAKTEAVVRDIDFDDRVFKEFQPYRLPKKQPARNGAAATNVQSSQSASGSDDSVGQSLKVELLYRPSASLSDMFINTAATKGPYYDAAAIRQAVTRYIETNDLIMPTNKRMIRLDPKISNAVLSTSNPVDKDVLAKGTIPRDALNERATSLCGPFHVILRNGQSLEEFNGKPKAGAPPKVGVIIETRGGNRTVTRVHGFEIYFVDPQPLADELRKSCAGSTSVEPFKGGKGMEVMVQGPQKDAVIKALERRGVNKNWVEVTDKTKKKK